MANIFLDKNIKNYILSNNDDNVYGTHGTNGESVTVRNELNSDFTYTQSKNLTIDSNIELVNFEGNFADYSFVQSGNILKVYDSKDALIANIGVDDDGSQLKFADTQTVDVTLQKNDAGFDMYVGLDNLNAVDGVVSDGYIAYATVFADLNKNGILDENEPQTTTDANGNFSLQGVGNASLISKGGVDISTGLAFNGSFTAPGGSTTLSPITTLMDSMVKNGATLEEANSKVATALGISNNINLKTFDPIATANNTELSTELQAEAIAVQSAAVQIANILSQTAATVSGAGISDELSATSAASKALVDAITSSETLDLAHADTLTTIIQNAATTALESSTLSEEEKTTASSKIEAVKTAAATATANINTAMKTAVETASSTEGKTAADVFKDLAKVQVAADDVKKNVSSAASGDETASTSLDNVSSDSVATAASSVTDDDISSGFADYESNNTASDTQSPTIPDYAYTIIGNTLSVSFSEYIDRDNLPDISAWSVIDENDNSSISVTGYDVGMNFIALKLGSSPLNTTITVTYTDPTSENDIKAIQDEVGNDLATTTKTGIVPITTADDDVNPYFSSILFEDANTAVITFSEALNGYISNFGDIKIYDQSNNLLTYSTTWASYGNNNGLHPYAAKFGFDLNSTISEGDSIKIVYDNASKIGIYDTNVNPDSLANYTNTVTITGFNTSVDLTI